MEKRKSIINEIDVFEYEAYRDCISFYGIFEKIVELEENIKSNPEILNPLLENLVHSLDLSLLSMQNLDDRKNEGIYKLLVYTRNLAENIYNNLVYCLENEMEYNRFDVTICIASEYCDMYKSEVNGWKQLTEYHIKRLKRIYNILIALAAAGFIFIAGRPCIVEIINKVQEYIENNDEKKHTYDFSDIEEKLGVFIPVEEENLKRERIL